MSYQSGLTDKHKHSYTEPVVVSDLSPSHRFYQRASFWICTCSLIALIIIIALSAALAGRKECTSPPTPSPIGFLADNGCLYSTNEVVNVQSLAADFYRCATVHNSIFSRNALFNTTGDIHALEGCYWDLTSVTTPDFQKLVNLQNKLTALLTSTAVLTSEKLRLKFIDAEVTLVKTLVEKGHFFAATAAAAADYAWWSDVVIDSSLTARLLAMIDHSRQAGYETTVMRWLENYNAYLPRWRTLMEKAVAENKTHANIVMQYQKTYYLQAFDTNFSAVCQTYIINSTDLPLCHSLADNITSQHASMRDYFVNTYLPACALARPDATPGLWHTPDGKEVYEAWLKYHLGTTQSARSIYDLGVSRVAINRDDINTTIAEIDPSITSFEEAVAVLSNENDSRWFICNNDTSEIIQYVQLLQARIEAVLLDQFGDIPGLRAVVRVEGSPSTYANAAEYDHTRNFWASEPIYNVGRNQWCNSSDGNLSYFYDRLQLATVMHEAMPGHAMQLQLETEVDCGLGAPFASGPTAYTEGWGLYAEALGYWMGWPDAPKGLYSNPFDELSYFTGTMLRNNRLQADTGLHGDLEGLPNWSWDRAWQETVANGFPEFPAKAEIERYIQMPGQATAYMVGNLNFQEMRQDLEEVMGLQFSDAEFHNIILRWGGATFDDLSLLLTTYMTDKMTPGSATNMFGYDLIKQQFSSAKPVIGLGRSSAPKQGTLRPAAAHSISPTRVGGRFTSVRSQYQKFP